MSDETLRAGDAWEGPRSEGPGSRIGPYTILRRIGEGGFGVVFEAEQEEPVKRRVALKVIKLGMAAGDPDPVDPRLLMDRSLTLVGGDLWNVLTSAEARQQRADRLFAAVRAGDLAVKIGAEFALRDGAQAHALLEGRGVAGKVLLIP